MNRRVTVALAAFALGALWMAGTPVMAQAAFPTKPVTIIVAWPAGGLPDVVARALATALQPRLGQPVVIENKPGANSRIAAEACARAQGDGHTLCVLSASTLSINPWLYDKLRYSPEKSFVPITNLVAPDVLLAVNPSVPAKTWPQLLDYAKRNPGKLAYASFGVGSDVHLEMDWIRNRAGIDLLHVPFLGFPQIMQSVGGGDVQIAFVSLGNPGVVDYVKTGKLSPIALQAGKRSALAPDVPTLAEAGVPRVDVFTWFGLFASAGTPKPVQDKLNTEVNAIMNSPEFIERMTPLAVTRLNGTSAEFARFLQRDRANWGQVVKTAGARLTD
ncbi:MAG: tripartite tricarboxylate transporter substrate binding protein [Ramlibacter sp.]|nr:tripartite tricarboxylate transporter substrate binding protein [Ramlibacter sp.]